MSKTSSSGISPDNPAFHCNRLTKLVLQSLVIAAACIAVYRQTLNFQFAYDDFHQIQHNILVNDENVTWTSVFRAFWTPTYPGDLFRPLPTFTYRLTFLIFGLNPLPYHVTNIVLHSLCSVLVFLVFIPICRRDFTAFFAALLFALHPLHVEAVANIIGRTELLAAFFGLLSLLMLHKAAVGKNTILMGALVPVAAGCFLLATLSKESALTIVLLFPLYIYFTSEKNPELNTKVLKISGVLFLTAMVSLTVRILVLKDMFLPEAEPGGFMIENPLSGEPFLNRIVPVLACFGTYIQLLALPVHLSADYSQTFSDFWDGIFSYFSLFKIILFFAFLLACSKLKLKAAAAGGCWYVVTFLLSINLVVPIGTVMGERLAYLPSAGFCLFTSALIWEWLYELKTLKGAALFLASLLCIFYLQRTITRTPVWYDHESIFKSSVKDSPKSPKSWYNLALYWYHTRKDAGKAEECFREALRLFPDYYDAAVYMIDISLARGKLSSAEFWTRKSLGLRPDNKKLLEKLRALRRYRNATSTPAQSSLQQPRQVYRLFQSSHQFYGNEATAE